MADTVSKFRVTCRRIVKATAYKSALYEVEYAPGVITNVYASSRAEAIRLVMK